MADDTNLSRRTLLQSSGALAMQGGLGAGLVTAEAAAQTITTTPAKYVIARLKELGVDTMFGIPGATCDEVFTAARAANMAVILTATDIEAGYAADGYARMRGLGFACVSYGPGTLSLINAIAGAYAERSPVVILNGGPGADDLAMQKDRGFLFSHSIGREATDLNAFREVTAFAGRAEKFTEVVALVDRALSTAVQKKRPVYIEINKRIWETSFTTPVNPLALTNPPSGREAALATRILTALSGVAKPAILLGIELQRYKLADQATRLVQKLQIPWSTTLVDKSVIAEQTPGFVGVYDSGSAPRLVKRVIEGADKLLVLGPVLGVQHIALADSMAKIIRVFDGNVRFGTEAAQPAEIGKLIDAMQAAPFTPRPALLTQNRLPGLSFDQRRASPAAPTLPALPAEPGITYDELMRGVSDFLDDKFILVTDTSLSMYPAADVNVTGRNAFICNAIWQSIGYSVGAAVGIGIAQTDRRPLVVCGDGGFQISAASLSTIAKHNMRAIVIVIDNGLYGIEQYLIRKAFFSNPSEQALPFLVLPRWKYSDLAKSMGLAFTRDADTPAALAQALNDARNATGPAFITALVKQRDLPSELRS